jgi:periplasmic protein TonB
MPGTMFQELVSSRVDSTRKWYTLPLSFVIHTGALAIFVVAPLVATDVLPTPRFVLEYMITQSAPSLPPAVPTPRQAEKPTSVIMNPRVAPVEAPMGVGVESGIEMTAEPVDNRGLAGIVEGFWTREIFSELLPVVGPVEPVRPGGHIKPPTRIKDVLPIYPEIARSARVEGVVIIEAIIGADGKVQNAKVLRSRPLLDEAALDAVRAWEYTPTLLNGQPVPVIMTVTVQFTLN